MGETTVTLEDLQGQSLEEVLQRIADQHASLTVCLADGQEVTIQPKTKLKPLPILDGYVPSGWKEMLVG